MCTITLYLCSEVVGKYLNVSVLYLSQLKQRYNQII